ncbi:MAG: hypothetical protein QM730_17640 [Anaerolineales bacterium]
MLLTVVILTACSWLIGIANTLRSILFVSVGLITIVGGSIFIIYRYEQNERSAFIILAGWFGFSGAMLSLLGMLMDPRSAIFSWTYFVKVAGIVWAVTFFFIILMTPIGMALLKFWRKNFANPISHRK